MELAKKATTRLEIRPIEKRRWHGKSGSESFKRPHKIKALVNASTMEYDTGLTPEDAPHPFWDSNAATLTLENNTMFLNLDNPLEYIKSRFAKKSRFVANSMLEYEQGLWPDATHVIFDESEEIEVKATKVAMQRQAVIKSAELSKDRKIQIILILSGKNLKGRSDNFIEVELDKLVQKEPRELLRHIDMDTEDISLHALIEESLQKSVLRKSGHKILYMDHVLGGDVLDVIQYLKQPDNQDLKLRLMSMINKD